MDSDCAVSLLCEDSLGSCVHTFTMSDEAPVLPHASPGKPKLSKEDAARRRAQRKRRQVLNSSTSRLASLTSTPPADSDAKSRSQPVEKVEGEETKPSSLRTDDAKSSSLPLNSSDGDGVSPAYLALHTSASSKSDPFPDEPVGKLLQNSSELRQRNAAMSTREADALRIPSPSDILVTTSSELWLVHPRITYLWAALVGFISALSVHFSYDLPLPSVIILYSFIVSTELASYFLSRTPMIDLPKSQSPSNPSIGSSEPSSSHFSMLSFLGSLGIIVGKMKKVWLASNICLVSFGLSLAILSLEKCL